ncbi:DUF1572 family protein [Aureivirga sp. CE67]|uniref:DUF1572 family protein n=1 Tax=Aureivirga sp. CE67 TaxID=1788983 RepID=UPI0018C9AAD7|nr:DUF1572 family protein [Aureivirga sp. CE67]
MNIEEYKKAVIKQFNSYKAVADKTINQLEEKDLFWKYNEESNSIAIIIHHIYGNMLSRWTDFFTSDGEKEWRNREKEFSKVDTTKEELMQNWEKGWKCLFDAIDSINDENINADIYIRNEKHSVVDALSRQMMHYPYHIGQITFIGKMILDDKWESTSIPKGKSEEYNKEMFSKKRS